MILADAHCHLNHDLYKKELDALLERSKEAGVKAIICSGINVPTNREALALAKKYAPLVRCSLGIYPVDALGQQDEDTGLARQIAPIDMEKEIDFIKQQKDNIVGIGEAGLDFHWIKDEQLWEKEKENFAKVIKLAEDIRKPLIVHSRDAEAECVEMLQSSSVKTVVLHCFMGRKHIVQKAIDLGYYFSIPAVIQKLQHFKIVAEMANINQLLSETDGPWLSPIPGKPNEPANVIYVIRNIAQVKNFTEEEVANNLWLNFQRVFG